MPLFHGRCVPRGRSVLVFLLNFEPGNATQLRRVGRWGIAQHPANDFAGGLAGQSPGLPYQGRSALKAGTTVIHCFFQGRSCLPGLADLCQASGVAVS